MKALAFLHASEGSYSPELQRLRLIRQFGVEAVTGERVLYHRDVNRMICAENIYRAFFSRQNHKDGWADWVSKYPVEAELLISAEKLCQ